VATTLVLYAAGVVLGILLYTQANISGLQAAVKSQPAYVQEMVAAAATIFITGLGLIGCLVGIRFVHRKPIGRVFTDGRPFGIWLAIRSAVLWGLLWLAWTVCLPGAWQRIVQRTGEIPLAWWPVVTVAMLLAMTVGRTAEEVVFRGYLLTRVTAWVKRPWLAVCITAVLFAAMHRGANWPAYTAIALFGIGWGAACIRAGTLAPMIGAHVAHDTLQALLLPNDANATSTWLDVVFVAAAMAIWLGWLLWATRSRPTETLAQPGDLAHG
jgi:membrane protease YdiL (CAAX protease family)